MINDEEDLVNMSTSSIDQEDNTNFINQKKKGLLFIDNRRRNRKKNIIKSRRRNRNTLIEIIDNETEKYLASIQLKNIICKLSYSDIYYLINETLDPFYIDPLVKLLKEFCIRIAKDLKPKDREFKGFDNSIFE